jgi:UDP-3-O-[3-hydroxymyristoyl] glucosamine N-acyltransferase
VLERIFQTDVGDALGADFTLVDDTADVHAGAKLVPPVYVGPGAVVADGARLGSLAVLGPRRDARRREQSSVLEPNRATPA